MRLCRRMGTWLVLLPLLVGSLAAGCAGSGSAVQEPSQGSTTTGAGADKPLMNLVTFPVDYGAIQAQVVRRSLESKGYPVKMHEVGGGLALIYLGLAQGEYDIFTDAWSFHDVYFDEHSGKIEMIGNIYGENVPTGLVVPSYLVEQYGLKSIEDLKAHRDLFRGKIYGYEAGTGGMNRTEKAVEVYELDGWEIVYGSVPTLMAELKANYDREQPIVYVGWRPHPSMSMMDLQFLEDPQDVYGTNHVGVGVNVDLQTKAPEVYSYLKKHVVPTKDVEAMMQESDEDLDKAFALGSQWWEEHKKITESWWNE